VAEQDRRRTRQERRPEAERRVIAAAVGLDRLTALVHAQLDTFVRAALADPARPDGSVVG
jgi:hypothetical protein